MIEGNDVQPHKEEKVHQRDEDKEDDEQRMDGDDADIDADAANAGPDKADENGHVRDKIKEDDGDADAIPDGDRGGNQIEKPKQAVVDEGFKFANEVCRLDDLTLGVWW